jgi:hypothetical protein
MLFTGAFVSFSEDLFLFETADFIVDNVPDWEIDLNFKTRYQRQFKPN